MDVVDQLRYRDAELRTLAENGHDRVALKRRLADLYRAQGIEVSDQILDAGIQAQHERRYVYVAPTGWKAWLAGCWVGRRRLLRFGLAAVLGAVLLLALVLLVAAGMRGVRERDAERFVAAVNEQVTLVGNGLAAASARLRTLEADLAALEARAPATHPDRLAAMTATVRAAQHDARAAVDIARVGTAEAPLPTLVREAGVTRTRHAADVRDQAAVDQVRSAIIAAKKQVAASDAALVRLQAAMATFASGVEASEQLEAANTAAIAAGLNAEAERLRQREYAAGDAALRMSRVARAEEAAGTLRQAALDAASQAALADALVQLRSDGLATGVAGEDRRRLQDALSRAEGQLRNGSLAEARQAQADVAAMVALLQERLEYRIVNRGDTRSGVWRYNQDAAGGRNYYLVVEALDGSGTATALQIRNEETGTTEAASTFAVRVPMAVYDRVAADKQDNGLIEDDLIGIKARGRLSPSFSVPVAGGYITEW